MCLSFYIYKITKVKFWELFWNSSLSNNSRYEKNVLYY